MLFLNNPLLTLDRIIYFFEQEIVNQKPTEPLTFMLYRMGAMPTKIKNYKNSYLLVNDKLFYVKSDGILDEREFILPSAFIAYIASLPAKTKSIQLTPDWIEHLVALNPGHQPEPIIQPPSALIQLQNKLKEIFFEHLDKAIKDEALLEALEADERFKRDYPRLKAVLKAIFSLRDHDDKASALRHIKSLNGTEESQQHLDSGSDWGTAKTSEFFKRFESRYGYFSKIEKKDKLQALFTELVIACRTIIILFENNNTPEDTMAYEYAYKLMALLVEPADLNLSPSNLFDKIAVEAHKLISSVGDHKGKPFHDALQVKLALPDAIDISDREGWLRLIKQEGIQVSPFLAMAKKIEKKIQEMTPSKPLRAPKTLKEASVIAMFCTYDRANEDLSFADLCYQYKVPENCFNASLDYIASCWPKKGNDSLPNLTIQGQGVAERYYWVKLPSTDKRALILGHMTDCCQSMAGDSEQCVKDGISLSDNGFYVLLKQRKKGQFSPIKDGEINENDFTLVGQSYAWKSCAGNLCLDSIECLKDGIPNLALQNLITDFATQVLLSDPTIRRVNVGRGGKTPKDLFQETSIAEKIKQGISYGDSLSQYCIAKSTQHQLNTVQNEALQQLLSRCPPVFQECINYLSDYIASPIDFVEKLSMILQTHPNIVKELSPLVVQRLLIFNKHPNLEDIIPIDYEALKNMGMPVVPQKISFARLMSYGSQNISTLLKILPHIPQESYLEILKLKNEYGISLMQEAIDSPDEMFITVFNHIPETERPSVLQLKTHGDLTLLAHMLLTTGLMPIAMTYISQEVYLNVVLKSDATGVSLIADAVDNPSTFIPLFNRIPASEQTSVLQLKTQSGRTIVNTMLRNKKLMPLALERLSENERIRIANETNESGETILHQYLDMHTFNLDAVRAFFFSLPAVEQLKLLDQQDKKGKTLLDHTRDIPSILIMLLNVYPEEKKLALAERYKVLILVSKQEMGRSVNSRQCREALQLYPEDKRLSVVESEKIVGNVLAPSAKLAPLGGILQALKPLEGMQYIRFIEQSKNVNLLKLATKAPDVLATILNVYPEHDRLEIVQRNNLLQDALETLGKQTSHSVFFNKNQPTYEHFAALFNVLPKNIRMHALTEKRENGKCLIEFAAEKVHHLEHVLSGLTANERFNIAQQYLDCFDHCNLFPTLKEILLETIKINEEKRCDTTDSPFKEMKEQIVGAISFDQLKTKPQALYNLIKEEMRDVDRDIQAQEEDKDTCANRTFDI